MRIVMRFGRRWNRFWRVIRTFCVGSRPRGMGGIICFIGSLGVELQVRSTGRLRWDATPRQECGVRSWGGIRRNGDARPHPRAPLPQERGEPSGSVLASRQQPADGSWVQCAKFDSGNSLPAEPGEGEEGRTRCAFVVNSEGIKVSRVTRTMAFGLGVSIYDVQSRRAISPDEARARALDKAAYDQNYECAFADENLTLLSHELISAAERDGVGFICERDWSESALALMRAAVGNLYVGFDVGRKVDLSVITVLEKVGSLFLVRGILRIQDMRLPEQELRLGEICRMPRFHKAALDMTGLGLGLFEYAEKAFGSSRIKGINFCEHGGGVQGDSGRGAAAGAGAGDGSAGDGVAAGL